MNLSILISLIIYVYAWLQRRFTYKIVTPFPFWRTIAIVIPSKNNSSNLIDQPLLPTMIIRVEKKSYEPLKIFTMAPSSFLVDDIISPSTRLHPVFICGVCHHIWQNPSWKYANLHFPPHKAHASTTFFFFVCQPQKRWKFLKLVRG